MTMRTIREDFCVLPFYSVGQELNVRSSFTENLRFSPFFYDLSCAESPWQQWQQNLPLVFKTWRETNDELITHFKNRDRKAAKEPMIAMIALLMDAIFWLNERPIGSLVDWQREMNALQLVPVNVIERMQFMLEAPDHFHSYNQLKSLFEEVEKSYFRKLATNK